MVERVDWDELRRLRQEDGLTQAQIGSRLGVSQPTVARWLRGFEGGISSRRTSRVVLQEIPLDVTPEDRRKLLYVREQLASGQRGDQDVTFLAGVYRDLMRPYTLPAGTATAGAVNNGAGGRSRGQLDLFTGAAAR